MPEKKKMKVEFERKQRANTGCLRGILYFLIISGTSLFLAVLGWGCVNDVLALTKPDKEVTVSIPRDYTIPELSRELAELGLIEKPWLFTLYCNYSHAKDKIEPGSYTINSSLDYNAIIKSFVTVVEREVVEVRVIEGKNLEETFRLIAEQGVCGYEELLKAADEEEFSFDFLEDLPVRPGRLEGYLYPDTYLFYTDVSPRSVLLKFLNNFKLKLTPSMRNRLNTIEYDLNGILTIASMIEMEAASDSERNLISSVIYNRLGRDMRLDIDATVYYLVPERKENQERLTAEDLEIDSPYNTRRYAGLPPGPICSPSYASIRAALYPASTKYLYYALDKERNHRFFNDSASFERFIKSKDFIFN
ncbi:MAG: endolytic transglycosylase MltG [Oscillospiraceae bacterium]|jgi:UPF0755 protein|nr:endolytic transglycosylase MltG [Oscillospiraceae bacterium]